MNRKTMRISPYLPLLVVLIACAEPEPALRVGEARFGDEQVAGLTAQQRALLADLAALGQAVADGEVDSIVAPIATREADRSRLASLPYVLAAREAGIGDDSLRSAYAAAPEWELSVRHVVRLVDDAASEVERREALERAREAERRARAGEDFAAIAADLSEEPGAAERGGLLEPGRRGSWVAPFWDAASALEPGEVSPVTETEYGYHVLRLDDRRPVPFEEADRAGVLRRVITPAAAMAAMEAWATSRPPVVLDPPAVLAGREMLSAGEAPDTLILARSPSGGEYDAFDLALAWAALEPAERESLGDADDERFAWFVQEDVRQAFWAAEAADLGAEPEPGARAEAEREWRGRVSTMADGAGFRPGLGAMEIAATSLAALHARGQEAMITRAELPGLRPLLRRLHPPTGPAASPH